jgi:glycerol-3-phosphate dehydrogenase
MIGVEVGGAVKNVLAIEARCCFGCKAGHVHGPRRHG